MVCRYKKNNLLLKNKSKFVSLKRIIPIVSFILFIAIQSPGQASRNNPTPAADKVKLYPNPATSYITFELQNLNQKGMSIQIYHFLGRKMYETQNVNAKTTIDLGEFNRGVYIYHLRDQSGKLIESGKFQVSK